MDSKHKILSGMGALLLSFTASGQLSAADYYMSPSGSDSNPGTQAAPWKSIDRLQDAQSSLRSGDTVYFRGGEYVIDDSAKHTYYSWRADGVTYKNYSGETPVLVFDRLTSPKLDSWGTMVTASGDNMTIDGLNFKQTERSRAKGMPGGGAYVRDWTPTALATWSSNVKILNCSIENFSGLGIFYHGSNILVEKCRVTGTGSHGFYIAGKAGTYRYNEVDGSRGYDNQQGIQLQYQSSIGNKIYGNLFKNGQASGVVFSGSVSNNEVFNNVFINAGSKAGGGYGYALSFWCEKDYADENGVRKEARSRPGNKFYNNTVIGKSNSGVINTVVGDAGCEEMNGGKPIAENVEIYNNIFYPSQTPAASLNNIPSIKNNIFYNIKGSAPAGNMLVNPNLKNPNGTTSDDAMLTEASVAAIDKAPNGAPLLDYRSGSRPVGAAPDIGAFELGAPPGPGGGPLGTDVGISGGAPVFYSPDGKVCPSGY